MPESKDREEAHGRDSVWGKARFCVHPDLPSEDGMQVMLINIAEGVVPGPTASTPRGPHPRPAESETREGAGRVWATNPPDDFEKCSGVSATGLEQVTAAWGHTRPSTCFCESSVTGTQLVSILSGVTAGTEAQGAELSISLLSGLYREILPALGGGEASPRAGRGAL